MGVNIQFSKSYYFPNSWILANIIELSAQSFCERFFDYNIDPKRRLYDQAVLAARSGVANIAEGTARHSTSMETELRLLDVARGSIDEVEGDIFNFLLRRKADVWAIGNPDREAIWKMRLDEPKYSHSIHHEAAIHILKQKAKFDPWIENNNPDIAANAIIILFLKLNKMLQSQMEATLAQFKSQGGFTENMTQERLESRRNQAAAEGAPSCPKCGKPMLKRIQRKGQMQGREFWGCSDYPNCNGTRRIDDLPK